MRTRPSKDPRQQGFAVCDAASLRISGLAGATSDPSRLQSLFAIYHSMRRALAKSALLFNPNSPE